MAEHYEQLPSNYLGDLDEMSKFLEICKLSKLAPEKKRDLF